MCDEFTEADLGLTRRAFTAMGAAAALTAYSGAHARSPRRLTESMVDVPMADGTADCFFVHPAKGKYPAIILWPDIGGLRDAKKAMARRLAAAGYAVLAVNHYYRSARSPVLASFAEWRTDAGRAKIAPMAALLTPEAISHDAAYLVRYLDEQRVVDRKRGIGTQGYCMTGSYTIRAASAAPDRIRAAASFHGGGLATDKPESPHNLLIATQASYLIAVARNDDARAPAEKERFRAAAVAAGRPAEIEVYAADHGWCVPDSPSYNQAEADRAWARLLALYAKL